MNENTGSRPFGVRDKIGYFCGDFANNFLFMMAGSFLMVFYMRVLGINGAIIGTMFLLARVLDAFTDIGMGQLVDRMNPAKDGKFRPWIRRMCGPVVLASFLMYQSGLAGAPMGVKIAYMFVTYLLFGSVCYTVINIPFGSLASAITSDSKQQSSLSSARTLGGVFGSIIVSVMVPQFIYQTDTQGHTLVNPNGFMLSAGIIAVISLIAYIICYVLTTERIKYKDLSKSQQVSLLQSFKAIVTNKAFLAYISAAIVLLLSTMLTQSLNAFLYADYFGNKNAMSMAGVVTIPITIVLAAFASRITGRFGKKEGSVAGLFFSGLVYLIMFIVKIQNAWVFVGATVVASIGMTYFNLVNWAMVTDIIDYQDIKTGSRADGTIYGAYSFSRKIGQALAGGLGGFAMAAIGYDSEAAVQTEAVKQGIYGLSTLLIAIMYIIIALILLLAFPLNKKTVDEDVKELSRRRANQTAAATQE